MATQLDYAEIVKRILREYAEYYSAENEPPLRVLFDDEQQSYVLLDAGWYGDEYVHNTPVHIDIVDNQVWIQHDDTEAGIATDLLEAGIPPTAIVLGFRHPEVRVHTEFAVR